MALFDVICTIISVGIAVSVNFAIGNPQYWNVVIIFGVYCLMNFVCHCIVAFICRSWQSGPCPAHLIIIIPGYIGHFIPCKGLQDSFRQEFAKSNTGDNNKSSLIHGILPPCLI